MKNIIKAKPNEYHFATWIKKRIKNNLNFLAIAEGQTGCSPKGTKVMLSNGEWKNIEDIKIGENILSPQKDGTYKFGKVIKTFKWKSKENYDVFQLNKKKEKLYSCSSNHEIPVWHNYYKTKRWELKNITSKEMAQQKKYAKGHQDISFSCFPIPLFEGRKNCEIEPYTLGVFLGDGMFRDEIKYVPNKKYNKMKRSDKKEIYMKKRQDVNITTMTFEIMEEVSKHYSIMSVFQKKKNKAKTYYFSINSKFPQLLMKYNLNGKKSGDKFIPKQALFSDIEYRKKLLAGLIDTDGSLSKNISYSITTKSKQLAEDVLFLVYSLGGRGSITKTNKAIKRLGFVGEYYRVSFFILNQTLPIKIKYKIKQNKSCYINSNRIAIEVNPSKEKEYYVYGFTVDTPSHYYITNNFMITKNSGKSWGMLSLAYNIDPEFSIDQVAFSFREVMTIINSDWFKKKKWKIILFDEPQTDISNRAWQSLTNKLMNYLVSTFRHQNIVLLFATPYSDFIDSQTKKLIHCVFDVRGHSRKTKKAQIRPKLLQYNSKMKKFYEHSLYVIDRGGYNKLTMMFIDEPPKHLIKPYEEKKTAFTDALNKDIQRQLDALAEKNAPKILLDDDEPEPIHTLSAHFQRWYHHIENNPDHTMSCYAQELGIHQGEITRLCKKCDKIGINIRKYIGKKSKSPNQKINKSEIITA